MDAIAELLASGAFTRQQAEALRRLVGIGRSVGKGTTAARPALTAADAGALYFDTTLAADGKPIWWTGTAWVDALGAST